MLLPIEAPLRVSPQEAYRDLKTPDLFGLMEYQRLRSLVDLRTSYVSVEEEGGDLVPSDIILRNPAVVAFYRSFLANCKKRGIPLFIAWLDRDAGLILHAHFKDRLTPEHWRAYEAIGYQVAKRQNHKVVHLGLGVWAERGALRRRRRKGNAAMRVP